LTNYDPDRIEEIWFAGGHADVGGGYAERRLADVTLRFMMARAAQRGLLFAGDALDDVAPNPLGLGRLHANESSHLPTAARRVGVRRTGKWASDLRPRIHSSVIARMESLGRHYRPGNLLELGGAYDVVE
jgi:hypothetical protein